MCNGTLPPPPCVVLDFMMRLNQSVVVSNVLIVLSDAARQDQFGGFKVNPESIELVAIPTDGSESTTKGKYYKEIVKFLHVFFRKWPLIALRVYFIKHLCEGHTSGLLLFLLSYLNKTLFLKFFMDRVAPYLSLVASKSELTLFSVTSLSHVMRAVYRPGSE